MSLQSQLANHQKLNTKVTKVEKKKAGGKKIRDDKLLTLKLLLAEKRAAFEQKLVVARDEKKQLSLETKLSVINAHIGKIDELLTEDY